MLAATFVGDWGSAERQAVQQVWAALEAAELSAPDGTINIKLVGDDEISRLNEQSTGQPHSTDVLTFSYLEDGVLPEGELADIAISRDTAERQASAAGTTLANEIALLALHGTLHTLGYDHQDAQEQKQLDSLQAELMASAGLTYREFAWE